jgi:hypothetical protein
MSTTHTPIDEYRRQYRHWRRESLAQFRAGEVGLAALVWIWGMGFIALATNALIDTYHRHRHPTHQ